MRKTVSSFCGAIVLGITVIASQTPESVAGDWAGDLVLQGTAQFAMLHMSGSGPSYEGSLELPFMGEKATLNGFNRDDRSLVFTASNSTYSLHFVGEVKGGMFEGSVQDGPTNVSGDRFRFAHLARIDFSKYTGGYDLGGGRVISISPIPEQDMGAIAASVVQYTDTGNGRWGTLFPISPTRFISGGPAARVFPAEIDVSFSTNRQGQITGLIWRETNRPMVRASKANAYPEEEVRFTNGGVSLAGTLMTPKTTGRHPAVVLTHGSGPQLRQRGILEQLFVRSGFAVLTYDKRGMGGSGGSWQNSSFEDLADDAVSGARMLQTRPDVDPRQIGFWGLSQGGWIAPLAAARFGETAFVIAASGGGLSPELQELLDTEDELRGAGFPPAEIADAIAFQKTKNAFMRSGEGWDLYQTMRQRVQNLKWYHYGNTDAWGPATATNPYWANQRRIYFYDPASALEKLACPVLFVFGELGSSPTTVMANVTAVRFLTERAGNPDVTISVIPNAGPQSLLRRKGRRQSADRRAAAVRAWLSSGIREVGAKSH